MFCCDSDKFISYPALVEKHKIFFTILSVQYFVFYESLIRGIQSCRIVTIFTHFESFLYSYIQCPRCKAVFHKQCKLEGQCPRCLRRRSRRQIPEDTTNGHEQTNAALNSLF